MCVDETCPHFDRWIHETFAMVRVSVRRSLQVLRIERFVHRAQRIVGRSDPHPKYQESYRAAEHRFWSHIPRWIWQDFHDRGASAVLDVGCAYGTLLVYTQLITGCAGFGTDFNPVYMSDRLRESRNLSYARANIELDPVPWDRTFDIIVFTEVLEHLCFQAGPTLRKLAHHLAPGGRIYLSTPDAADWGSVDRYYTEYADLPMPTESVRDLVTDDHIWQFSEDELLGVIQDADLEVVRFSYAPGVGARHFNVTLKRSDDASRQEPC